MFEDIFGLVENSLRLRGYTTEEIDDVIYAIRHLDYKFVLKKRRENKEKKAKISGEKNE